MLGTFIPLTFWICFQSKVTAWQSQSFYRKVEGRVFFVMFGSTSKATTLIWTNSWLTQGCWHLNDWKYAPHDDALWTKTAKMTLSPLKAKFINLLFAGIRPGVQILLSLYFHTKLLLYFYFFFQTHLYCGFPCRSVIHHSSNSSMSTLWPHVVWRTSGCGIRYLWSASRVPFTLSSLCSKPASHDCCYWLGCSLCPPPSVLSSSFSQRFKLTWEHLHSLTEKELRGYLLFGTVPSSPLTFIVVVVVVVFSWALRLIRFDNSICSFQTIKYYK